MREQTIKFKKGTVIEVSFATVKEGMQAQLFGEYFPKVMPIIGEIGGQSLGSFKIENSKSSLDNPQMCALFEWPNLEGFKNLHSDLRFIAIKDIRDDTLSYFLNGLFFTVEEDVEINFNDKESYILSAVLENAKRLNENPLVNLSKAVVNSDRAYQPTDVQIDLLNEENLELFNKPETHTDVFKLRMNFPA